VAKLTAVDKAGSGSLQVAPAGDAAAEVAQGVDHLLHAPLEESGAQQARPETDVAGLRGGEAGRGHAAEGEAHDDKGGQEGDPEAQDHHQQQQQQQQQQEQEANVEQEQQAREGKEEKEEKGEKEEEGEELEAARELEPSSASKATAGAESQLAAAPCEPLAAAPAEAAGSQGSAGGEAPASAASAPAEEIQRPSAPEPSPFFVGGLRVRCAVAQSLGWEAAAVAEAACCLRRTTPLNEFCASPSHLKNHPRTF
jgi:hypothetical protein